MFDFIRRLFGYPTVQEIEQRRLQEENERRREFLDARIGHLKDRWAKIDGRTRAAKEIKREILELEKELGELE